MKEPSPLVKERLSLRVFPHLDVLCGQEALKDLHGQDRSTAVVGNGFEEAACAGLAEDSLRHVAHRAQELRHDHGEENLRPLLHSSDDLQLVGVFFPCCWGLVHANSCPVAKDRQSQGGGRRHRKTHQIKVFCIVRSAVAFSQILQVRPVHKDGGLVAELGGIGLAERAQGLGSLFKVHELRAPPMHRVVIEARRRRSDDRILGACLSVESLLQLDISSMHDVATRPDHRGRERAHRHVHDVPQQAVVHAVCGR